MAQRDVDQMRDIAGLSQVASERWSIGCARKVPMRSDTDRMP